MQENSACVFLRGCNGVTVDTACAALASFADELGRRLGVSLRGDRPALLAVKPLEIDGAHPANLPDASDWLRGQAQDYDAALREFACKSHFGDAS